MSVMGACPEMLSKAVIGAVICSGGVYWMSVIMSCARVVGAATVVYGIYVLWLTSISLRGACGGMAGQGFEAGVKPCTPGASPEP
jgi:hypothetical protein